MKWPKWKERIYDLLLGPFFLFALLAPPIALPVAQRVPVKGPLFMIAVSALILIVWGYFGPSAINGMLNGIASILVVAMNLFGIVLGLTILAGNLLS